MPPALTLFGEQHADAFAAAARRSRRLHAGWVHPPTTPAAARALALSRQGPNDFGFLVCDLDSGAPAGYVGVTNIVRGSFCSAYLGYYLFEGWQGRGYMGWALQQVMRRAWKDLKLHRLEANIQPGNTASIRLVQRLGFEREGYSPGYLKIGGRWRDHERWAVRAR